MFEKHQHPDLHFSYPIHLSKTENSEISDDKRSLFIEVLESIYVWERKLGTLKWGMRISKE